MSDTPQITTGDLEAPTIEPPTDAADRSSSTEDDRRTKHDVWVAGTEEPEWVKSATDEQILRAHDPAYLRKNVGSHECSQYSHLGIASGRRHRRSSGGACIQNQQLVRGAERQSDSTSRITSGI